VVLFLIKSRYKKLNYKAKKTLLLMLCVIMILSILISTYIIKGGIRMVTIDLSKVTGSINHGAVGGLYALNERDTPDINILKALKPKVIAQKAPDGLQHPGGDSLKVIKSFIEAGGEQVHIYLQDIYPNWPYDNVEIESYFDKVKELVNRLSNNTYKSYIVIIPFNEPDAIWFQNNFSNYLKSWGEVYKIIKNIDSSLKIGGPNFANYNSSLMEEFMLYCKNHNCIPDVITWHELNDRFFSLWEYNYQHFREFEKKLGFKKHHIVINEYARQIDLSVPGYLVPWITKLEYAKVDGCLAFWHVAGNFDDLVVENQKPNSAWWVYKWYGDMTGDTVQVINNLNDIDDKFSCLATLDKNKKQIRILCNGIDETQVNIVVQGFDKIKNYFGDYVKIEQYSVSWSGHEGVCSYPSKESEMVDKINNGKISLELPKSKSSNAYYFIISPCKSTSTNAIYKNEVWKAIYEAENVQSDGILEKEPNYFCSGNWRIRLEDNNYIKFLINVPYDGLYKIKIFYSTNKNIHVKCNMIINEKNTSEICFNPTLNRGYINYKLISIMLHKGDNEIVFQTKKLFNNKFIIDFLDIEYSQESNIDVLKQYNATTDARVLNGNPEYKYCFDDKKSSSFISLKKDDFIRFIVNVKERGFYKIKYYFINVNIDNIETKNNKVKLYVNEIQIKELNIVNQSKQVSQETLDVLLHPGINLIDINVCGEDNNEKIIGIEKIDIIRNKELDMNIITFEAENENNLFGRNVFKRYNEFASNGFDVSGIGGGADNYLEFNQLMVNKAGLYKLIIYYSNDELKGTHIYNTKVVDKSMEIIVNDKGKYEEYFRYTNNHNNYWLKIINIYLNNGMNSIRMQNINDISPNIDKIEISPITIE